MASTAPPISRSFTMNPPDRQFELPPWRRGLYVVLGSFFVGLGALGAFLPLLPTTPFLLLASFFYVRSSPRLNQRLLRSRLLGGFLRDWQQRGGVRREVKVLALAVVAVGVTASIVLGNLPAWGIGLLLALAAIGITVVIRLPLVADEVAPEMPTLEADEQTAAELSSVEANY